MRKALINKIMNNLRTKKSLSKTMLNKMGSSKMISRKTNLVLLSNMGMRRFNKMKRVEKILIKSFKMIKN
jgi:U3 small nucleolar RNA-associated protein 14